MSPSLFLFLSTLAVVSLSHQHYEESGEHGGEEGGSRPWQTFPGLGDYFFDKTLHVQNPQHWEFEGTVQGSTSQLQYSQQHYIDLPMGQRMAYLETGNPDGPPIIFVHGQPTWSYMWRNVMPFVAQQGRVFAIDQIGFGHSSKGMPEWQWRETEAMSLAIEQFVVAMGLEDVTFVLHDYGMLAGQYIANHPENVKSVIFFELPILPFPALSDAPPWQPFIADVGLTENDYTYKQRSPQWRKLESLHFQRQYLFETSANMNVEFRAAYTHPFAENSVLEDRWFQMRLPNCLPFADLIADDDINKCRAQVSEVRSGLYDTLSTSADIQKFIMLTAPGFLMPAETAPFFAGWPSTTLSPIHLAAGHYAAEDDPFNIGTQISHWLASSGVAPILSPFPQVEVMAETPAVIQADNVLFNKNFSKN